MASEVKNIEPKTHKNAFVNYLQESYQELRKVTWPTRNQAVRLTFLVLGFCLVTAVIVGALDFAFNFGHQYLISIAPESAPITTAPVTTTEQTPPIEPNAVVTDENGNEVPINIETVPANQVPATNGSQQVPATN